MSYRTRIDSVPVVITDEFEIADVFGASRPIAEEKKENEVAIIRKMKIKRIIDALIWDSWERRIIDDTERVEIHIVNDNHIECGNNCNYLKMTSRDDPCYTMYKAVCILYKETITETMNLRTIECWRVPKCLEHFGNGEMR